MDSLVAGVKAAKCERVPECLPSQSCCGVLAYLRQRICCIVCHDRPRSTARLYTPHCQSVVCMHVMRVLVCAVAWIFVLCKEGLVAAFVSTGTIGPLRPLVPRANSWRRHVWVDTAMCDPSKPPGNREQKKTLQSDIDDKEWEKWTGDLRSCVESLSFLLASR